MTAEQGLHLLNLSLTEEGSGGTPAQRLGLCEDSVAFAFDSAGQWCRDYYAQKREGELEESRREFQAALRGVEFP